MKWPDDGPDDPAAFPTLTIAFDTKQPTTRNLPL